MKSFKYEDRLSNIFKCILLFTHARVLVRAHVQVPMCADAQGVQKQVSDSLARIIGSCQLLVWVLRTERWSSEGVASTLSP